MRRAGAALLLASLVLAACGLGPSPTTPRPPCDDEIRPTPSVPVATGRRLDDAGITQVVGSGQVWFIAPEAESWSSVVEDGGDHAMAKVPVWVDADGPLPELEVTRIDEPGVGEGALAPTPDGLPGPVPARATFPEDGCWSVIARVGRSEARIVLSVD